MRIFHHIFPRYVVIVTGEVYTREHAVMCAYRSGQRNVDTFEFDVVQIAGASGGGY